MENMGLWLAVLILFILFILFCVVSFLLYRKQKKNEREFALWQMEAFTKEKGRHVINHLYCLGCVNISHCLGCKGGSNHSDKTPKGGF